MTALSSTVARAERPAENSRLHPGWWLLPSIIGGTAIWVGAGVMIVRWLF